MRDIEFPRYVRQRMKKRGLNQTSLAQAVGMTRPKLNALLNLSSDRAAPKPTVPTLVKLAVALQVHPLDLVNRCYPSLNSVPYSLEDSKYKHDHSGFVRDVTIPDYLRVPPGEAFEKVWEIQNLGLQTWEGRYLRCADNAEVQMKPHIKTVPIRKTEPGETVQIAAWFTAPAHVGRHSSYWKMFDAVDELCFPKMQGVSCNIEIADTFFLAIAQCGK